MATVYKVELELVSDWVNYTPETLAKLVEKILHEEKVAKVRVTDINIERK